MCICTLLPLSSSYTFHFYTFSEFLFFFFFSYTNDRRRLLTLLREGKIESRDDHFTVSQSHLLLSCFQHIALSPAIPSSSSFPSSLSSVTRAVHLSPMKPTWIKISLGWTIFYFFFSFFSIRNEGNEHECDEWREKSGVKTPFGSRQVGRLRIGCKFRANFPFVRWKARPVKFPPPFKPIQQTGRGSKYLSGKKYTHSIFSSIRGMNSFEKERRHFQWIRSSARNPLLLIHRTLFRNFVREYIYINLKWKFRLDRSGERLNSIEGNWNALSSKRNSGIIDEQHLRNAGGSQIIAWKFLARTKRVARIISTSFLRSPLSNLSSPEEGKRQGGAFIEFYLPLPSCTVVGQIASGIDLLTLYDALPLPPLVLRGTGFR